ncbi:hypothetical protein Riv7116_6948 (plasmid) [Rivularia sp. PCC 7116]|uniref:hypothetical protein n=1 Tax=Rivularia sp. PCC 7116 TaxID=373994 RepID=UPI00029EE46E|nr:hypothetical protein [Rivularia sp. PCC 7116]AFY59259.1 hypothetical protein Riv7116_6948 [Rivularia sp. PCC 7116]
MINRDEAPIDVLLSAVLDDLAELKRYRRFLELALDSDDLETIHLLIECFDSHLECQHDEAKWGVEKARLKFLNLLKETE